MKRFVEKPDEKKARSYLEDGRYFWNSGIFVFQIGALQEAYRRYLPEMAAALEVIDYDDERSLEAAYREITAVSIDYGIMEKADGVVVIPAEISWSDLGNFAAIHRLLPKDEQGNYCEGRTLLLDSRESLVMARSRLVGAVGLEGTAIVETPDALLVCPLERSQEVSAADGLEKKGAKEYCRSHYCPAPWGSFTVLELGRVTRSSGSPLILEKG